MDLLRVEQQHQQLSSRGDIRQFRYEAESRGASPQQSSRSAVEPAQMRELHAAVRELVAHDLHNELEPLRVQLALQQKQLQLLEYRYQEFAQQAQHTRSQIEHRSNERSEKKQLDMEPNPGFEAFKAFHERRLSSAEHIMREMSLVQDKSAQRQDGFGNLLTTLMHSFSELDEKIDKVASSKMTVVPPHMQPDRTAPPASMGDADFGLSPLPETLGRTVESVMSNTASCVFTKSGIEVEEFTFEVDRTSGSLGLMLKNDGDMLAIEKINSGCILPVNVGDRLVAVNGVRDDNNAMLEELRRKVRLSLTCERALFTTI